MSICPEGAPTSLLVQEPQLHPVTVCISTVDADGLLPHRAPQDTSKEWREAQISW